MSIDPDVIWCERYKELGQSIEANCEALTHRWAARAILEQPTAQSSHFAEMRNNLPELLREMGQALAQSAQGEIGVGLVAFRHGEQRWKAGWQLAEVVRDFQILRLVLLEHLEELWQQEYVPLREVMAIGLALDESIRSSVLAYVAHQTAEVERANERSYEFLAVLGHELRNPLHAINSILQLIDLQQNGSGGDRPGGSSQGGSGQGEKDETLAIAQRQVDHMRRLLDDMVDVSRIRLGSLRIFPETIDGRGAAQRAVDTTATLIGEKGHELTVTMPESPVWIWADPARTQQVLVNLLTNAAKYTPAGGQIRLSLAVEEGMAAYRVRDTGVGISSELLPRIFQMFAQAPEHGQQGMGIGLSLAQRLVEVQGGELEGRSEGIGKGAEFIVRLPLAPPGKGE